MCIIILDEEDIYPDGIAITHTSLNRARATVGSVSDGVRIHRAQKLAPDRARFWFRQRFVNTSRHFVTYLPSTSDSAMTHSLKTSAPQYPPLGKRRIRSGLIFSERDSGDVSGHGPRHRSFPTPAPASIHTSKSNIARRAVRCSPDAG